MSWTSSCDLKARNTRFMWVAKWSSFFFFRKSQNLSSVIFWISYPKKEKDFWFHHFQEKWCVSLSSDRFFFLVSLGGSIPDRTWYFWGLSCGVDQSFWSLLVDFPIEVEFLGGERRMIAHQRLWWYISFKNPSWENLLRVHYWGCPFKQTSFLQNPFPPKKNSAKIRLLTYLGVSCEYCCFLSTTSSLRDIRNHSIIILPISTAGSKEPSKLGHRGE